MRVQKILCDRCGKEIEGFPVQVVAEFVDRETGESTAGETDYIPEDAEALLGKEFCVECTKRITGRAKIDSGKVRALKRAGWSVEKIAEEFDASVGSIYNVLARLKKEEARRE